jgi:transcriptional regulator with XRE-family HTH domain
MPGKIQNRITGRELAAARALVGLAQRDVAQGANISESTLKRLEARNTPVAFSNNFAAVKLVLKHHGVEFIDHGVRLMLAS